MAKETKKFDFKQAKEWKKKRAIFDFKRENRNL